MILQCIQARFYCRMPSPQPPEFLFGFDLRFLTVELSKRNIRPAQYIVGPPTGVRGFLASSGRAVSELYETGSLHFSDCAEFDATPVPIVPLQSDGPIPAPFESRPRTD